MCVYIFVYEYTHTHTQHSGNLSISVLGYSVFFISSHLRLLWDHNTTFLSTSQQRSKLLNQVLTSSRSLLLPGRGIISSPLSDPAHIPSLWRCFSACEKHLVEAAKLLLLCSDKVFSISFSLLKNLLWSNHNTSLPLCEELKQFG